MAIYNLPELEHNPIPPGTIKYRVTPLVKTDVSFQTVGPRNFFITDFGNGLRGHEVLNDTKKPGSLYGTIYKLPGYVGYDVIRLYVIDPSGQRVLILH